MNVPGKVLTAFKGAIPSPDDTGPQPRTFLHVAAIEEGDKRSVVEAASGRVALRCKLRRETAAAALISRDVLSRLKQVDDVWVEVDPKRRVTFLRTESFEAHLERDDGRGKLPARFPDLAEMLGKFRRPSKGGLFFRTEDLLRLVHVAMALDVDTLALCVPKVTGGPCYVAGELGDKALSTENPEEGAGELEAVIAQVDPFGSKDEKPAGAVQAKLFADGPAEDAPPPAAEEPAAPAAPRKERAWVAMDPVVGLSLYQPWAAAVALGLKEYETRSWPANISGGPWRGWVAIAATKDNGEDPVPQALLQRVRQAAAERGVWGAREGEQLPAGAIVALAFLDADFPTNGDGAPSGVSRAEINAGDWSKGRRAFRFSDVLLLPQPIPVRGGQRLYQLPEAVHGALADADLVLVRAR